MEVYHCKHTGPNWERWNAIIGLLYSLYSAVWVYRGGGSSHDCLVTRDKKGGEVAERGCREEMRERNMGRREGGI